MQINSENSFVSIGESLTSVWTKGMKLTSTHSVVQRPQVEALPLAHVRETRYHLSRENQFLNAENQSMRETLRLRATSMVNDRHRNSKYPKHDRQKYAGIIELAQNSRAFHNYPGTTMKDLNSHFQLHPDACVKICANLFSLLNSNIRRNEGDMQRNSHKLKKLDGLYHRHFTSSLKLWKMLYEKTPKQATQPVGGHKKDEYDEEADASAQAQARARREAEQNKKAEMERAIFLEREKAEMAARQAAKEKAAKEKALADEQSKLKADREAADRQAAQKLAADKAAKEEADRAARQALEAAGKDADKAAREAAERAAREKADRAAKEAADKSAKEASDRAAKEAADKAAREAADRAAKQAADKAAKEAADKLAREAQNEF